MTDPVSYEHIVDCVAQPNERDVCAIEGCPTNDVQEIIKLRAALSKLNEIRNSIVGVQGFNFSEHAYPMVAALNEAGFEGLPYPEAKANVGTLIERATLAEDAIKGVIEQVESNDTCSARMHRILAICGPWREQRTTQDQNGVK